MYQGSSQIKSRKAGDSDGDEKRDEGFKVLTDNTGVETEWNPNCSEVYAPGLISQLPW